MAPVKAEGGDEEPETRIDALLARLYAVRDQLLSIVLLPLRALISRPAQKFYIGSVLFTITFLTLLFLSTVAFVLLYWNYVPAISLEENIYLQFRNNHHPVGTTLFPPSSLSSLQPYDISVSLHLPRSPSNLAAGNFMLDLHLLSFAPLPASSPPVQAPEPQAPPHPTTSDLYSRSSSALTPFPPGTQEVILHRSRRPTLLTYRSPLVSTAKTVVALGLHLTGWTTESELMEVKMFEGVKFARGWRNVPSAVRVKVETLGSREIEVYGVTVRFGAKLKGLRYILYTFPLTSALVFITAFYLTSLTSALFAYVILAVFYSNPTSTPTTPTSNSPRIKRRSSSTLSDTPRSFPTRSSQPPLQYLSQPLTPKSERDEEEEERGRRIKLEEDDEDARADVEDFSDDDVDLAGAVGEEDLLAWRDSGIGTGVESERLGVEAGRRRKSGRGMRGMSR